MKLTKRPYEKVSFKLHRPRTYLRMVKRGLFGAKVVWEPKVWKELKQIQGKLFVDIGANEGLYTLALRKHFKNIIAIEPHPETVKTLMNNSAKYRQKITIMQLAISNTDGKTMLHLQPSSQPVYNGIGVISVPPARCSGSADTILEVFHYRPASMPQINMITNEQGGIEVMTRRLDSLFNGPIDLVKIDVEGAEFLVLEGARKLFALGLVKRWMVELHDRERKKDLEKIFQPGYHWIWVDSDHLYAEKR